ncbi:enoyl-CoA hydratase-related protein, partial [Streptomyces roseolus]|uniref:enoyl-CoA hydratase-related protein n=1 Tax=Streptomyces roseolus TaxID=67358 RepID=UPI003667E65F
MSTARTTSTGPVRYERRGPVAVVTMDRPEYRNAQNSAMTYALDRAFYRAAEDGEVKVVVLAGAGEHVSAGPDNGTPPRDAHQPVERRGGLGWGH